ncbi:MULTISPECIES: DUF459 domain-containing protein [unclassified Acinetobacter]|uniref:SGNH/GDSL hydrolase family protein n=1 Tax=unclassified Acinetobacter TaxID=196816 RepID=UPI0035B7D9A7
MNDNTDAHFESNKSKQLQPWKVGAILASTLLLVTWVKQDSISSYWQQSYQNTSVFDQLSQADAWRSGQQIQQVIDYTQGIQQNLTEVSKLSNKELNQTLYPEQIAAQKRHQEELAKRHAAHLLKQQQQSLELDSVSISSDQKVFFAGDSMMQGVAPWVMRDLQKQYQVKSIDLSKQSTGLSYSTFFDWPKTIENTLTANPDIGALIIFLGPNDPWDVSDPQNGKRVIFNTPRWNQLYAEKIQRILKAAQKSDVQVLWVTPPTMKRPELSQQMDALRQVYHQTIPKNNALVIDSKPLLLTNGNESHYSDSINIDGKITKVRTADGIHFTADGQKLIAQAILQKIKVKNS